MPFYNLLIVEEGKIMAASAKDRSEALAVFGKRLGVELTLKGGNAVAPYLLDEWTKNPHWSKPNIPVFLKENI